MKSLYLPDWDTLIRYQVMPGTGAPIVWLSGLNTSCLPALGHLAGHARLATRPSILIDYLGTGLSETPADFPHTMEAHAATIAAVLDHEGAGGTVVVGHSMGGTVGICLALSRPDLVSALIVAEGNLDPGGGGMTRKIAAESEDDFALATFPAMLAAHRASARDGDNVGAYLSACWRHSDPRGIHRSSVALVTLPGDFRDRYLALAVPRAFIFGEASLPENTGGPTPDTPDPALMERHGVAVRVIAGAGHLMVAENPDGFADAVAGLL